MNEYLLYLICNFVTLIQEVGGTIVAIYAFIYCGMYFLIATGEEFTNKEENTNRMIFNYKYYILILFVIIILLPSAKIITTWLK